MKFNITREDLLKGRPIPPTWYLAEVTEVTESEAKKDNSHNWNITLKIVEGDQKGVTLYQVFNEKGKGFAIRFLEAIGFKIDSEKGADIELERAIGRKVKVFVKNELYEGKMLNRIQDYMPATQSAAA
jgi:hypothetical protein